MVGPWSIGTHTVAAGDPVVLFLSGVGLSPDDELALGNLTVPCSAHSARKPRAFHAARGPP